MASGQRCVLVVPLIPPSHREGQARAGAGVRGVPPPAGGGATRAAGQHSVGPGRMPIAGFVLLADGAQGLLQF